MLLLFAAGLVARLAAWLWIPRPPALSPTAGSWWPIALELARGGGFVLHTSAGELATARVPPLAPWLASGVLRLPLVEPAAVTVLFAVLGALTPLAVMALGTSMFGGGAGRWGGWLAALDPFLLFIPSPLAITAGLTLSLALLATSAWLKTPRPGRAFGVGLLWGAGALAEPALLVLAVLALIWAWVPLGLTIHRADRARQALLLIAGLALVVLPWTARNASRLHAWVPVATGHGIALLAANEPHAWSDPALRGAPLDSGTLASLHPELRGLSDVEADRRAETLALSSWATSAARAPGALAARAVAFFIGSADPRYPWLPAAGVVLLPFLGWGIVRAGRGPRRRFQSLPLVVAAFAFLLLLTFGAAPDARLAFDPVLALLAGVGADDVRRRLRARAHGLRLVIGRIR